MKSTRFMGVVVLAVLALAAIPSMASALPSYIEAQKYPAALSGVGSGSTYITDAGSMKCATPTLTAEISSQSNNVAASLVSNPSCYVETNNCELTFHPGTAGHASSVPGTFDVGGAKCTYIGVPLAAYPCKIKLLPQTGLAASFSNKGSGSEAALLINVNAKSVKYKLSGPCFEEKERTNGTWISEWEVKGLNGGNPDGVHVSGATGAPAQSFFFWASGPFQASSYPAQITGEQTLSMQKFKTFAGTIKCEAPKVFTELAAASNELIATPEYSGCITAGAFPTTMDATGCSLTYKISGSGTNGSGGISCSAGHEITYQVLNTDGSKRCTITVPSYSPSGENYTYKTVEVGGLQKVEAIANMASIEYHVSKGCDPSEGTYADGTFTGGTLFTAYR